MGIFNSLSNLKKKEILEEIRPNLIKGCNGVVKKSESKVNSKQKALVEEISKKLVIFSKII
jgi:hypothetical protein